MSQSVQKPLGESPKDSENKPRHHLRSKDGKPKAKQKKRKNTLAERSKVYRANLRAFNECREAWPDLFNLAKIKPFMVGIRQQLLEDAKNRGLEITGGKLYNAIYWTTSTYEYQLSMCKYKTRFDINGNEVGEVTPEQRASAQLALKNLSDRANRVIEAKRRKLQQHRRATAAREMGEEPKKARPQSRHRPHRPQQPRAAVIQSTTPVGQANIESTAAKASA